MSAVAAHVGRVTQARVALSEWTKLRSVRSTRWSFFAAVAFAIGLAALVSFLGAHQYPHDEPARAGELRRPRASASRACSSPSSRSACSACS